MAEYGNLSYREVRNYLKDVAQYGICGQGAAIVIDIGSSKYINYFSGEVLENLILKGGSTCKFYIGPYGSGKSHLLQLIETAASDREFAIVDTDLDNALSLENWKLVTSYILSNLILVVDGEPIRSLGKIVCSLGERGMINTSALKRMTLPHPGIKNSLLKLSDCESLDEATKKLLIHFTNGERVRVSDLRALDVKDVKGSLTKRNSEIFLNSALTGFHTLSDGIGILLMFDENEKSLVSRRSKPSKKIVNAANLMRRFVDSCLSGEIAGTIAVFAVLPDFLDNCWQAYPALGQRLESDLVHSLSQGWRAPVADISILNSCRDEEDFMHSAVKAFIGMLEHCGFERNSIKRNLQNAARTALQSQAGDGYRRPMMKALAATAIQHLNKHGV